MTIFTRLTTSISAAFDRAVGSIENHDAVIQSSIGQIRKKSAEVKARLKRVRSDGLRMEEKIVRLEEQARRWEERATATGTEKNLALECVQRRKNCLEQAQHLRRSREQLREVEQRLSDNTEQIDKRLQSLQQQRSVMRSRQAAADACRVSENLFDACGVIDIDETLERWDAQIMDVEMHYESVSPIDDIERRFIEDEDKASLEAELAALQNAKESRDE